MHVELRRGGQTWLAELDIEEEVRRGRLYATDEVLHPPWTGRQFRRLSEIPALDEAFDAPDARFAAWVRARRFPWLALATVALVGGLGAPEVLALKAGWKPAYDLVMRGAIGYESLLLDGRWWTPWTSQVLHAGPLHLVMNLPVLAYCGYRVERALGPSGFLVVGASAVAAGALAVALAGTLPVVGASILAFGFWGAQITIGFRVGTAMPPACRGFYGWGNLIFFLPLFAAGLAADGVSHVGHLGGLLGGIMAAALVKGESFAPRNGVRRAALATAATAAAIAIAPMLGAFAPPGLAAWPAETVDVTAAGASLTLPWRMALEPTDLGGIPAWRMSSHDAQPIFCTLTTLTAPTMPSEADLAEAWEAQLGAGLSVMAPPPPLASEWSSHRFRVSSATLDGTLVEYDLRRGAALLRVGYFLSSNAGSNREALYEGAVRSIVVREPPALVEARRKHLLYPDSPEVTFALADALVRVGDTQSADPLWEALLAREDGWRWEAMRGRLRMWRDYPGDDDARGAWLLDHLPELPPDQALLREEALAWLGVRAECDSCDAAASAPTPASSGG